LPYPVSCAKAILEKGEGLLSKKIWPVVGLVAVAL
jgi:hypothetical protein